MDRDPVQTAVRSAKRDQRLGLDTDCSWCGVQNLEIRKSVPKLSRLGQFILKSLLERHHVCGKANDSDLTIILCPTCHARANESLLRADVSLEAPKHILDRMIRRHMGMAAFHRDAAEAEDREAEDLDRFRDSLDREYSDWRKRTEENK